MLNQVILAKTAELPIPLSLRAVAPEPLVLKPGEQITEPIPCCLNNWQLVPMSGRRRMMAAIEANLEYVPCVIKAVSILPEIVSR